jgi:hypothetical protein
MASVAGARRTQSTFPSYLASANASDLQFTPFFASGDPIRNEYSPKFFGELAHLPHVRSVAAWGNVFGAPLTAAGKPYLPEPLANNQISEVAPVNGMFFDQDKVIADQGRLPDPRRADEFAVTAKSLELMHWRLGQTVPVGVFSLAQFAASSNITGFPKVPPVLTVREHLVGVVALDTAVVHDEVDSYPTLVIYTPALTSELVRKGAVGYLTYAIKVDGASRNLSAVQREIIGLLPSGTPYNFHVTSVVEGQVERSTKPESIALGVFGAIAALAALLIGGQAVSRSLRSNRSDMHVLRALGASRSMLVVDSLSGMIVAVFAGAVLAVVVCVALSPVAPLGVVRQVDPSAGFASDWTVIGAGFALFFVGLSAIGVALALLAVLRMREQEAAFPREASRIVGAAARMGMPPSSIAGIRFAVERGRGQDAVPVGSALLGAVLAVAVVVTTLTFGNGLSTLVSHPSLYGWNWNYAIQSEANGNQVPLTFTGRLLDQDKYVASWSGFNFADAQIDDQTVPIMIVTRKSSFSPPILSGHEVRAPNQVVLGGTTLAALHKHVGDSVVLSYGSAKDYPVYVPPTKLKVVGIATLPAIGAAGTLHPSMGTGALVPYLIEPPAMRAALTSSDPLERGYDLVAIRMRSSANVDAGLASLRAIAQRTTQVIDSDPNSGGGVFQVLSVQQPAEIVNYKTMGATPAILAAGLAVGAVVALGLTLVASVRRRRRDLALLKTLGFAQRQLSAVVSWQASVAALVGVVVGVPFGIILGRALWTLFAHQIVAVPRPTVPALETVLVAIAAMVLANAVAFVPGRIAARTTTAALLRSE